MTTAPPRGPKFPLRLNQLAAATVPRAVAEPTGARSLLRPQRPLAHAHAHADATRRSGASGL
ncbi:MAG: hypothetical protein ABIQ60_15470, partial [Burkholderiaceae bacterium]